jgi:hypothetical protein
LPRRDAELVQRMSDEVNRTQLQRNLAVEAMGTFAEGTRPQVDAFN